MSMMRQTAAEKKVQPKNLPAKAHKASASNDASFMKQFLTDPSKPKHAPSGSSHLIGGGGA
jgi:hypothetical protein